eukprot:TRINITY_DN375_c1_g1_i1.p1 TRINITY_DN375_c1_g1~~TRINITY_DN375_c1_g1_i1.p1  ORF type:complete len:819 (+),score=239.18 TRINITY_DN375_c1_g1_i1:68-2458(+)
MAEPDGATTATEVLGDDAAQQQQQAPCCPGGSGSRGVLQVITGSAMCVPYKVMVAASPSDRLEIEGCIAAALDSVHATVDSWNPSSEISRVGAAEAGAAQPVSAPTIDVLSICDTLHRVTGGLFDPTVAAAAEAFHAALLGGCGTPEEAARSGRAGAEAAPGGWGHVHLDPHRGLVRKDLQGLRIDLCGVAKGYAVDTILLQLRELGYGDCFVDWGGDLRCCGRNPLTRKGWTCGVAEPPSLAELRALWELRQRGEAAAAQRHSYLATVRVGDLAVATSGDYSQPRAYGFNANAFHPAEKVAMRARPGAVASATVLAETAAAADGVATALMLLPSAAEAVAWLDERGGPAGVRGALICQRAEGGRASLVARWGTVEDDSAAQEQQPQQQQADEGEPTAAAAHHLRDLLKSTPHQLCLAAARLAPGAEHPAWAATVSSAVLLPGVVLLSLMRPSRLSAAAVEQSQLTVHPLREGESPAGASHAAGAPGELRRFGGDGEWPAAGCGLQSSLLCTVRLARPVGDHLLVVAAIQAAHEAGGGAPPLALLRRRRCVASLCAGGGPPPGSAAVGARCLVSLPAQAGRAPELCVAAFPRPASASPLLLSVVAAGEAGWARPGARLRVHFLSEEQGALADLLCAAGAERRPVPAAACGLRLGVGQEEALLPLSLGHCDCEITEVAPAGAGAAAVVARVRSAVSLSGPALRPLAEAAVHGDAASPLGVSWRALRLRAAEADAEGAAPLGPLLAAAAFWAALVFLFVWWVMWPYMFEVRPPGQVELGQHDVFRQPQPRARWGNRRS